MPPRLLFCATLAVCVVLPVSTSAKRTPIGTGRTRALARLASECPRALVTLRTLALAGEPQDLRRDQEKPDCFRHGERPIGGVRFLFLIEGNFRHCWITVWRQEREARPVLTNPAISNVDWDTEPIAEIAGGAT